MWKHAHSRVEVEVLGGERELGLVHGDGRGDELGLEDGERLDEAHGLQLRVRDVEGHLREGGDTVRHSMRYANELCSGMAKPLHKSAGKEPPSVALCRVNKT